jgi:hypothetical protein
MILKHIVMYDSGRVVGNDYGDNEEVRTEEKGERFAPLCVFVLETALAGSP